jgi:hypothetical protein
MLKQFVYRWPDLKDALSFMFLTKDLKYKQFLRHPIQAIGHTFDYSMYVYSCNDDTYYCDMRGDCGECDYDKCFHWIHHEKTIPTVSDYLIQHYYTSIKVLWSAILCFLFNHEIEDCSEAGPDSGNMNHQCCRCGRYWSVPLY